MENQAMVMVNIVVTVVLAGLIGLEREVKQKPAGLRTHMLVGGAATLLLSLARVFVDAFEDMPDAHILQMDPMRIIEAIIVGISFIGAGTILQSKDHERIMYLTTAASILITAGVGIAVALNQYLLAVSVTAMVLMINIFLNILENKLIRKKIEG